MKGLRTILRILILTAATAVGGCARSYDARILEAAALIDSVPGEAVARLRAIDRDGLSRGNRALHDVKLADAMNAAGLNPADDSLLADAADYFTLRNIEPYATEAWMQYANAAQNAHSYGIAIARYMKAEELAAARGDSLNLGRIYRSMADIYTEIYHFTEALEYRKKELQCFIAAQKPLHSLYAKCFLLTAYSNAGNLNEAESIGAELLDNDTVKNDMWMLNFCRCTLGRVAFQRGDSKRTIHLLRQTDEIRERRSNSNEWILFLLTFQREHQTDSILYYADSKQNPSYIESYVLGNYQQACIKCLDEISNTDSVLNAVMRQNVTQMAAEHNIIRRQLDAEVNRNKVMMICICACMTIGIISVLLWLSIRRNRRRKYEYETKIEQARVLCTNLETINTSLTERLNKSLEESKDFRSGHSSAISALEHTVEILRMSTDNSVSDKRLFNTITSIVDSYRPNGSAIDELRPYVADTIVKMEQLMAPKKVKKEESALIIYMVLGFEPTTIAYLMNININSYYSRKKRLKSKLSNLDSPLAIELLNILFPPRKP